MCCLSSSTHTLERASWSAQCDCVRLSTCRRLGLAGEPLAEIIPANTPLVFYARISVADIQDIALGQPVKLFLSNMNTRSAVPLLGAIQQIDPDASLDTQTGARFFTALVAFDPEQQNLQYVMPGVTGSAAILVGKRSVLGYLTDPLWTQMRSALNEPG